MGLPPNLLPTPDANKTTYRRRARRKASRGGWKMSDITLTNDEKRCLQMWFRQAIVQLEREEATQSIAKFYAGDSKTQNHHSSVKPVRPPRTTRQGHKELV